ncbi:unnamed protein product [Closterium sp. Naga37s-1]|nr:unnamed protein product [Closterium sp. Naga37s-1]
MAEPSDGEEGAASAGEEMAGSGVREVGSGEVDRGAQGQARETEERRASGEQEGSEEQRGSAGQREDVEQRADGNGRVRETIDLSGEDDDDLLVLSPDAVRPPVLSSSSIAFTLLQSPFSLLPLPYSSPAPVRRDGRRRSTRGTPAGAGQSGGGGGGIGVRQFFMPAHSSSRATASGTHSQARRVTRQAAGMLEIPQQQEVARAGTSIADAGSGEAVAGAAASAATAAATGVEGREGVAITVLVVDDDDDCQIVSPPVRHTGHEARASHEARAQHERRVASRTRETRAPVRVSGEARAATWGENEPQHNDPMHRQVVDLEEEAGAEGGGGVVSEQVANSPEVVLVRGGGASRGLQGAVARHRSRGADGAAGRQRHWSSTSTGGAAAMGSAAVRSAAVSTATHRGMLRVPVSVQGGALRGGGGVGGSGRRRVEEPEPDDRDVQASVAGAAGGGRGSGGMEGGGRAGGGMHLVCSVCLDDMSEETEFLASFWHTSLSLPIAVPSPPFPQTATSASRHDTHPLLGFDTCFSPPIPSIPSPSFSPLPPLPFPPSLPPPSLPFPLSSFRPQLFSCQPIHAMSSSLLSHPYTNPFPSPAAAHADVNSGARTPPTSPTPPLLGLPTHQLSHPPAPATPLSPLPVNSPSPPPTPTFHIALSFSANPFLLAGVLPISSSHLPISSSHLPISSSHLPVSSSHLPISSFHLPISSSHLPVSTSHLPVSSSHLLNSSSHLPFSSSHLPVSSSHLPISSSHLPISSSHLPISSTHLPIFSSHLPFSSSPPPFSRSRVPMIAASLLISPTSFPFFLGVHYNYRSYLLISSPLHASYHLSLPSHPSFMPPITFLCLPISPS